MALLKRPWRLGLRAQILVTLATLLAVSLLVIYLVVRGLYRSALTDQRSVTAQETTEILAASVAELDSDPDALRKFVVQASRPSSARTVLLLDERLGVVLPEDAVPFWPAEEIPTLRDMLARGEMAYRYPAGAEAAPLWVLAPLPVGPMDEHALDTAADDGDYESDEEPLPRVAAVAVGFFGAGTAQRRAVVEHLILLLLALIIAVVLIVSYYAVTRLVVAPVQRLMRTVDRVGSSGVVDIDLPMVHEPQSELTALSSSVARMLDRLKSDQRKISVTVARLKEANVKLVEAQQVLVRSEKLASVGKLAAGVAHEIGNPISIIMGYLELLQRGNLSKEEEAEYLRDIADATDRVNQIIRDLLDFARPVQSEEREVVVGPAIRNAVKLVRAHKFLRDVDVSLSLPEHEVVAYMSESRLQQVIVNLLMNAGEAMEGKGRAHVTVSERGNRVIIEVADEGPGISEAEQLRVFDPFYTTKDPGHGTGLGLAICYNLVTAFEGDIRLESEPGSGTRFVIELWSAELRPDEPGSGMPEIGLDPPIKDSVSRDRK